MKQLSLFPKFKLQMETNWDIGIDEPTGFLFVALNPEEITYFPTYEIARLYLIDNPKGPLRTVEANV